MRLLLSLALVSVVGVEARAAEPVAAFEFAGDAEDTAGFRSTPIRAGSTVNVGTGYAYFDGRQNAFLDYGNGVDHELRLLGRREGQSVDALTIWARVSSRQQAGKTRVLVGRWGPQRSYQLAVNSEKQERDGRITAAFTATGNWTNYVQVETKASGLVKHDGTQTVDLAVCFDRGKVTLFLNGEPQPVDITSEGDPRTVLSTDVSAKTVLGGIVEPGQKQAAAGRSFEGIINAVRIYGQALSDAEIAALGTGRDAASARNLEAFARIAPPGGDSPEYQNPEMVHVSVEESAPEKYLSICPDVCELADGSLLAAYHRTGFVDWDGGYSTWTRVSRDGGHTWSEPRMIAEKIQAPGVVRLRSGDLLLNGCQMINEHSSTMQLFRSKDGGQTWVEQPPIWEKSRQFMLQGGNGSLVELKSGRILCPVFGGAGGSHSAGMQAWCYYSDDGGKLWRSGMGKTIALPDVGSEEPAVAELNGGTLVMSLRTSIGFVYLSRSDDHGDTWSKPWSSGLESPADTTALAAFPDGKRLLMIYCSGKFEPNHHHKGERTPLTAAVSDDVGKTWRKVDDIVGGPHEFGCCAICFTSAGKVVLGIDWERLPWERTIKTGGVRVTIADSSQFDRPPEKQK